VEDKRPAKNERSDQTVQHQRSGEVRAEVIAGEVLSAEFEMSGYGTLLTFELVA
jgi:hypothetical protein